MKNQTPEHLKAQIKKTLELDTEQRLSRHKQEYFATKRAIERRLEGRLNKLEVLKNKTSLKTLASDLKNDYHASMSTREAKRQRLANTPRMKIISILRAKRDARENFTIKDITTINPTLKYITVVKIFETLLKQGLLIVVEPGRGQGSQSTYGFPAKKLKAV